ncbi:hypothetical protein [Neomegalonema sp.]|uniref:hypothetical protein n=1 Tax=Neomegalonema sp. TaxID=2039713 RepID=UPI00262E7071|nr:hypothetical protein [Neomegalonema sp.]MDD2869839.1 hypothetical protein [Neomegalonema sp.]
MREKLMQWLSDLTPVAEKAPEEADFGLDMAPPPETLARAVARPEPNAAPLPAEGAEERRRAADQP